MVKERHVNRTLGRKKMKILDCYGVMATWLQNQLMMLITPSEDVAFTLKSSKRPR